uniref:Retrovirus-related Pol polyprotein from transposon TNT 1-94-like beta-barrel domain-containing protein n=1 Tax=Tanacetum cinerariifolium TaxID=118510 RepID=A0A699IY85_TANCI
MTNTTPLVIVTPPVNTIGASVTSTVANHAKKPEKFNDQNFKRWQQKMFFYLTTLNLVRFLKETAPLVEPPMEGKQAGLKRRLFTCSAKANMVEHDGSSLRSNSKGKGKDKRKNDKKSKGKSEAVDNGEKLYVGNSATADIKGEGDVILKMTSKKELKLPNVLYVLEIHKNLVFGWLLNKFDFRLVFYSDKYVGKIYAMNDIQKNAVTKSRNASLFKNIFPCLTKETGSSSRLDDEVVQDKRQQDDNDLQVERQDQVEEEVEPRRGKRARTE